MGATSWISHLALLTVALTISLMAQPSRGQSAKQWSPMFNPMCAMDPLNCSRPQSLFDSGSQCCPSCNPYSSACSPFCGSKNFSNSPCYSSCGDYGCQRDRCGAPVDGGSRCCDASKVRSCPVRRIYADSDCCPACAANDTVIPSPPQCRFNLTQGMGQPACDLLGNCKLAAVNDRRDDVAFNVDLLSQVCNAADLNLIRQMTGTQFLDAFAFMIGDGSSGDDGGGGGGGGDGGDGGGIRGNLSMGNSSTGSSSSNSSSSGGGLLGKIMSGLFPTSSSPTGDLGGMNAVEIINQMKSMVGQFNNFAQNLSNLPTFVNLRISSVTCRDPLLCIANSYRQLAPAIQALINPLSSIITGLSIGNPTAVMNLVNGPSMSNLQANFSARLMLAMQQGASCMSLLQTQTPCVAKTQAINMDELLRASRCDPRNSADFAALLRLAGKVADDAARNVPPGLGTLAGLNCSDVRSACVLDFVNSLINRVATGCVDANVLSAVRDRLRRLTLDCTGGPQNMTQADLVNALASCQLTADDVQKIAAAAPSKLQGVLQDSSTATINGAAMTVSSMVQSQLMSGCPSLKSTIDKAMAQYLDVSKLNGTDIKQMINVIRADQFNRIPPVIWLSLGTGDLLALSDKLKGDSERDAKCTELIRICNQSLLADLTACIDKIPASMLRSIFGSGGGGNLQAAVQSFNVATMSPKDIASSVSALRDLLSSVTATPDNCLTYMNSLFSFPVGRIDPRLCLNDTCFQPMCASMPDHPNTAYCRSLRPGLSMSSMISLGKSVMTQMTPAEVTGAISVGTDVSTFTSLISSFASTGATTSSSSSSSSSTFVSDFAAKLNQAKTKCVIGAVMQKFQEAFLSGPNLTSFSASSVDATILCQMNSEQLKRLPCTQMATIAYKAGAYLGSVNRGSGRAVVDCVCTTYAGCSNITATALSQISNYVVFLNESEIAKLPSDALAIYCSSMQSVSIPEKSKKMSMGAQRVAHDKCVSRVDLSSVGGSNSTDVSAFTEWNITIVKALLVCAITTDQLNKVNQEAVEYLASVAPICPFNETWLKPACKRLFKVYNDTATSGNYSMSTIGICAVYLSSGDANATKVSRDDVRTNCGSLSTAVRQFADAAITRASNGLLMDLASTVDTLATSGYVSFLRMLESGSPYPSTARRRKRAVNALTCTDIQNLASGVAQVSAAQMAAMSQSDFVSCFSTFGLTNANWSADQCAQIKSKTEAAYNTTSQWTSSVLLTVGCLTQCWSASEIANIQYSDVAHISDIGKYCSLMPQATKTAVVTAYITRAKANNSAQMTRTELSSLGYLVCGASLTYVSNFNSSNVLNSLTELGTPGPCDDTVMQSYVNRVKAALGSTVASWSSSYFTSLANLISGLTDDDIPTLTSSQIGYIDASVVSGMTVSKFKDFTPTQLSSFSASQRSAVTASQLAVLTASQKSALGISTTSAAGCVFTNAFLLVVCLLTAGSGRWLGL